MNKEYYYHILLLYVSWYNHYIYYVITKYVCNEGRSLSYTHIYMYIYMYICVKLRCFNA